MSFRRPVHPSLAASLFSDSEGWKQSVPVSAVWPEQNFEKVNSVAASSQAARHFYESKTNQKRSRQSRHRAGEAETSCPKKEDYMHANSTRNHRSTSEKIVADVVRVKTLTETDVRSRFAPTLSDWTEREQTAFTQAVAASHGWNYHNAMAVMAIQ